MSGAPSVGSAGACGPKVRPAASRWSATIPHQPMAPAILRCQRGRSRPARGWPLPGRHVRPRARSGRDPSRSRVLPRGGTGPAGWRSPPAGAALPPGQRRSGARRPRNTSRIGASRQPTACPGCLPHKSRAAGGSSSPSGAQTSSS